jgi:heparan-alpha-glucosaminide N-acetyltransferase
MASDIQPVELPARPARVASIDAYRGLVMFLMLAEVLRFAEVAKALPESGLWAFLAYHQTHVQWVGCSLHDLIQPSFSFLVGVALPYSIASRQARGQTTVGMSVHAFWRALVLIVMGILLRSLNRSQLNFTFEDTLTQIGLGYGFLFLLGFRPLRDQWIALVLVLAGYWAAFALFPSPPTDFDYARVGVPSEWLAQHGLSGFAAHWNKNSNLAWSFDRWFLNLFPRPEPFVDNAGGYATLSFIPTLGTMILGVVAGKMLRGASSAWQKVGWLILAGIVFVAAGLLLGAAGVCPVVKRIWTPSWTLFSGGICFLFLAGFYALLDILARRPWQKAWAFPLVVIGANSIAAYCGAHLIPFFIEHILHRSPEAESAAHAGSPYEPLIVGGIALFIGWLVLFVMYWKKIFIKI